ncbi:MAG: collagen-like protein [Solirubrobacteraceae bacterium]|nr:collagen-like protein [Solirubrobacteraceae bacterium]
MLDSLRHRLSYANVVASLALFVALGGTGYAAVTITGKNVKDGTLTGKDIKNSSVASADIKNGSLLTQDFKAGQLPAGAPGAPGQPGQRGAPGDKGDPGEPGSARAYAFVNSDGSVDETRSKGVADANVAGVGNSYCFTGLAFTPRNVVVTPLESYRDFMVEMGVCQFRVVLSAANGFMVSID